ncbi:hypothetical protein Tco_1408877 [Tanacetum coccineum]
MFPASRFDERFRMSRTLFTCIVEEVTLHCAFFREKEDCTGKLGISPLMKCTSAIRQLAYGTVPDALDEYLQMGHATSRQSLKHFCRSIVHIFGPEFLRKPTITNVERANNDINVTKRSPLLNDLKLEWVPFVKSVTNISDDDHKRLRYKAMHEVSRKDVERAFGVLKKK